MNQTDTRMNNRDFVDVANEKNSHKDLKTKAEGSLSSLRCSSKIKVT